MPFSMKFQNSQKLLDKRLVFVEKFGWTWSNTRSADNMSAIPSERVINKVRTTRKKSLLVSTYILTVITLVPCRESLLEVHFISILCLGEVCTTSKERVLIMIYNEDLWIFFQFDTKFILQYHWQFGRSHESGSTLSGSSHVFILWPASFAKINVFII